MAKKTSKLGFAIKNKTFFKFIYNHFFPLPNEYIDTCQKQNKHARRVLNYKYDCSNPQTFEEYLGWIKINYRNDLWKKCADKLGSKEFLKELGLDKYIVKTYGIYNSSSEIDLDKLPNDFVLKANHDCGSVFVCHKGSTNFIEVFKKLDLALTKRYSDNNGEWMYDDIEPKIFAEELLFPASGTDLVDYKFFMFSDRLGFGHVVQNRNADIRNALFDENYNIFNCSFETLMPSKKKIAKKPSCWNEMMQVASIIGKKLEFVRVDFYWTTDGPKIGELTFIEESGCSAFTSKNYALKFGELFRNTIFYEMAHGGKKS